MISFICGMFKFVFLVFLESLVRFGKVRCVPLPLAATSDEEYIYNELIHLRIVSLYFFLKKGTVVRDD